MKKNTWKRIFACVIAFAMMFTMMPGNNLVSRAEEGDEGGNNSSTLSEEGEGSESRKGVFDVDYSPDSDAAVTCVLVDGNNTETPCDLRNEDFVVADEIQTIKLTLTPPTNTFGETKAISVFVNGKDETAGNLATNEGTTTWTYKPSAEEAASDDGLWIRVFWTQEEKEFDDFAPDENGYILEYHNPDRVAVTVTPAADDRKDREAYGITRLKFADTVNEVSFQLTPEDSNEKLTSIFYLGEEHPVDKLSSDSEVQYTYDSESNCYTVTFDIDKLNAKDGNEKIKWLDFMFEGEHWPGNNMFAVDYDTYNGTADVSCTVDGTDCPLRGENGEPKPYTFNKENGFKTIVLTLEPPADVSGENLKISVRVNEKENAGTFGTNPDGATTWTYTPTSKEGLAIQVFWTEEEKQFNTFNPEYSQFMIQYSTSDNIEVKVTPDVSDDNKMERTAYGLTRVRFDKATEEVSFKLPSTLKQINIGETEYVLEHLELPAGYSLTYSEAEDSYILKIDTTNIANAELVSLYFDFEEQEKQIGITQYEQKITDLSSPETFIADVTPDSAVIQWSSSDERVAKVDEYGNVTPVANGVVMITASMADDPDIKDSVAVEVAANAEQGIRGSSAYDEESEKSGNLLLDTELPPQNDTDIKIDNNTFNFGTVREVIKKTGDISAVREGADAKLSLYVTKLDDSMIPADDKEKIAAEIAKLPASAVTEIMTLDMSAFLTMADATGKVTKVERLTDVEAPISAYVVIPERDLLKDTKAVTRHYFMVDMINGVATTKPLSIVFNTKLEITKRTFSTVCIGYYDTVNVTSVTLDKTEATLTKAGETLQLHAAVLPEGVTEKGVTWASGNTNVATVDETGKVTAVANGEAIITVTSKANADLKKTCKVTVKIPVEPAKQEPKPEPTPTPEPAPTPEPTPDVTASYHTHIQTIGDAQGVKKNGEMAGTSGMAKRLENIWVKVEGNKNLGIQYSTHCQSYGWLPWSANGELNGTSGEAKRLEAIKIRLTGADASKYDVYYRVHAQSYGWLAWASNGAPAGTSGQAKRLEGIQIVVVKKGEQAPGLKYAGVDASSYAKNTSAFVGQAAAINIPGSETTPNVMYKTHVQTFGWQNWMLNGQVSGTSGKAKRLEGINIKLTNCDYAGGIRYSTHIQTYGWSQGWKENGAMAGTSGQAKRLEAIKIELTGEMAQHYDIYYRVHAQSYGWLNWASNGAPAGTSGMGKRLEAIQIVLVKKGESAPANNYQNVVTINNSAYIGR